MLQLDTKTAVLFGCFSTAWKGKTMNEKVEIVKRGIIRAEEFEEFNKPLMGFVLLEIGFISLILGFTSVNLFLDLVLGISHFGFTLVI